MSITESVSVADGYDTGGNDIDELLDPDVFELPPVGHIPSLEEILKEPDFANNDLDFNEILDDVNRRASNGFDDSSEIMSIATSSSFSQDFSPRSKEWKKPVKKQPKSNVLRCVKLRGISAQILSADEKVKSGAPSAMTVGSVCVGIGTTHGLALVFDAKQVLKCCLGNVKNVLDYGGVSALCFNRDCTKLLIGYGKGLLLLYDIKSGRIVQQCDTIRNIGNAVLHCKFAETNSIALINDSGGSVYALNFAKLTKTNECRCIFSGSRGEVCNVAPLIVPDYAKVSSHHYSEPLLVAMASMTKVIVVRLRPSVRVIFASPCEGRPHTPPMLSWQFVPMQISATIRILDPVLAFGRDNFVTFYQLHSSDGQTFRSVFLQKFETTDVPLINCIWLNSRCILTINEKERAEIYEISSGECMETMNIDHVQLVYSTSAFKGLSTGGNVSRAMVCMADNVCYGSLGSQSGVGQVLLLGSKGVYAVSVNTWLERVDSLAASNDYVGAISLCLDFFTGKRKLGLTPHNKSNRWRDVVEEKTVELLLEYVELSLTRFSPTHGKIDTLQEHYKLVVPFCIDACVTLNREDILYDRLYARFSEDSLAKNVFLECLDDYIVDNLLKNIPPIVVQDFFNYLEREGLYSMIETCVVNLPVTSLDLHQVMTVCRTYGLYDGIIFVFSNILKDYMSPLKEMLDLLKQVVEQREFLSDEDIRLGNKVLLYISCCLCGRSYPVGVLEPKEATKIALDTYDLITSIKTSENSSEKCGSSYPYLRTLLKFDCREFLNGLGMAFDCDFFLSRNGSVKMRRLVDILIRIMLNSDEWTPLQSGALFTFITRRAVMQSGELLIARDQFQQILEVVMCGDVETVGTSSFEERQQALLDLLQLKESNELIDEKTLLSLAEKHHYYQVCETLYWRRREFEKILNCYVDDSYRKNEIFNVLRSILINKDILTSEKLSVKSKFVTILKLVADSDVKECAKILNEFFESSFLNVCDEFGENSEILTTILKEIYELRISNGNRTFSDDELENAEINKIFIKLLCKFNVDYLIKTLKSNDTFCTDDVLKICRKMNVSSAVIYLLMYKNELDEAFEFVKKNFLSVSVSDDVSQLSESLKSAVEYLNYCQDKLNRSTCEKMWFDLLNILLSRGQRDSSDDGIKKIINDLVQAMMNFVDPSLLLTTLLDHPMFKSGRYADVENMVKTILHGYEYEEVLLNKVLDLMRGEIHSMFVSLQTNGAQAVCSKKLNCAYCSINLTDGDQNRVVVFSCGHCYHCSCLQERNSFRQGRHGVREWLCFACTQKRAHRTNAVMVERTTISKNGSPSMETEAITQTPSVPAIDVPSTSKIVALEELHNGGDKNPFSQSRKPSKFDDLHLRLGPPKIN